MIQCRITVIAKTINPELAKQYGAGKVTPCPCFDPGQEFTCGFIKPENFCDRSWRDIRPMVAVLLTGGISPAGYLKGG